MLLLPPSTMWPTQVVEAHMCAVDPDGIEEGNQLIDAMMKLEAEYVASSICLCRDTRTDI